MISEKSIRSEKVMNIENQFIRWVYEKNLTGSERHEIKTIFEKLKELIDY